MEINKQDEIKNEKKEQKTKVKIGSKQGKKNKKIILIAIIIFACVGIFGINLFLKNKEYKKYEHYEAKMEQYGFARLYNNESAKTSETVTVSEATKLVIATCLNMFEIDNIAKKPTEDYDNAIWVLYAQDREIVKAGEVNKDTGNKKVKYIDVIEYFANAKKVILDESLDNEPIKQLADLDKYAEEEKKAVLDMLSNDILKVADKKLNGNKKIFKGQLNELVVNYIEKYDLLGEKIQTDVSKIPSNASEFAYISANVDKEVYEIPLTVDDENNKKSSRETYIKQSKVYPQMIEMFEEYFNYILNIDYNTIDVETLKSKMDNLTVTLIEEETYQRYVDYVKANKIKLSGSVKAQKPIIYYDGVRNKLRLKIDFKIENSSTKENILFLDFVSGGNIVYDNNEYSLVIDAPLSGALQTNTYYIKILNLNEMIVGNKKPGIHEKIIE